MNILNSKIFTVILSAISVLVIFSVISVGVERREIKKETVAIENKISGIKSSNELIETYVKNFDNPDFLEKEARIKLNYKSAGEEVVFVHKELSSAKPSSSQGYEIQKGINYKKWLNWILGE